MRTPVLLLLGLVACDPPGPGGIADEDAFPYVADPDTDAEDYERIRWETETWSLSDPASLALYLKKSQLHRPDTTAQVRAHHEALNRTLPRFSDADGDLTLAFVGDVMWLGGPVDGYADAVADRFRADLVLGNLETPTDPDQPDHEDLPDVNAFNAPVEMITGAAVDVWQVTNNHTLDVGDAGAEATVAAIEAAGKVATGLDTHPVVDVNGRDVAVLSYTWGVNQRPHTTTHELFILPFGHVGEDIDLSRVDDDVRGARAAGADVIVVMVHWGFEYEYYADPHFLSLGRDLVRAGADVVVGSGPHVVQPIEFCQVNPVGGQPDVGSCVIRNDSGAPRSAVILHSLGDFAATPSLVHTETEVGIIARVKWQPNSGVVGLTWDPVVTMNSGGRRTVQPLGDHLDDPDLAAESARLDALLGTNTRLEP